MRPVARATISPVDCHLPGRTTGFRLVPNPPPRSRNPGRRDSDFTIKRPMVDTRFLVAWIPLFAALTSSVAGDPAADAAAAPPAGYRLVWADEFETDGLPDPGRLSYDTMRHRQ